MDLRIGFSFPLMEELGIEVLDVARGWNLLALYVRDAHLNPNGILHGGVTFSLADTGMGLAVVSTLTEDERCASLDCRVSFLRSVKAETRLMAECAVLHETHSVAFVEAVVRREADGALVARLEGTFAIQRVERGSQARSSSRRWRPLAREDHPVPARALTIAGSDSGGGAGIQADLKTFLALGAYGMSAITAITIQNTVSVSDVVPIPPEQVVAQVDTVWEDLGVDAVKTGMLVDAGMVEAVAAALKRRPGCRLVVDPVMVAKSGDQLLSPEAREALQRELIPLAEVLTPNVPEAEMLLGWDSGRIRTLSDARRAAQELYGLGPAVVVLKGGHLTGPEAVDVVQDDQGSHLMSAPRLPARHDHGTGCTLSAAICAFRARNVPILEAIGRAKGYLTEAMRHAPGLGQGRGPLQHAVGPPDHPLPLQPWKSGG